jgi:hypothetical protein
MELTKECLEEIVLAAREADSGSVTITVQARPEDKRCYDFKCEYKKQYRIPRGTAIPTEMPVGRSLPHDKF